MDDNMNKKITTEDALEEVTGGTKDNPENTLAAAFYSTEKRDDFLESLSPSQGNIETAAYENHRESFADPFGPSRGWDNVHDPESPDYKAKSMNEPGAAGIEGSKTAFDNFFEKLWWNINRLFK